MKAVILAAGRGRRLGDLTEERPKCLVELSERPLLDWQLTALKNNGINDIFIVTGYQSQKLEQLDTPTIYNPEWETSNMVVTLLTAFDHLEGDVIISYSDIVYDAESVCKLLETPGDLVLAYDKNWRNLWSLRFDDPLDDAESFCIDNAGRITDIGQKVSDIEAIKGQYMGLFMVSDTARKWIFDFVELYPERRNSLDMTTLFWGLIQQGKSIFSVAIDSGWCEIDSPRDLSVAMSLIEEGKLKAFDVTDHLE